MARFLTVDPARLPLNPRAWGWLPDVLRADIIWLEGMSWTRVRWLFGVALVFGLWGISGQVIRAGGWAWPEGHHFVLDFMHWFVRYLVFFAPVLITLTIADNLPVAGNLRIAVLAVALVLGAQIQWPVTCAYDVGYEEACEDFPSFLWRSWIEIFPETTVWAIIYSTPMAMVYFYRRRDQDTAKALHDSEIARTELQRRMLEADLHTMQARVEPSFLFDTLGDIGELQGRDPEAGEQMLDELIRYLRAALPDTAAARSTLGKEAVLGRAYLAILRIRMPGRLEFGVDIPRGLENAPIPAMVVLPLLAAAIGEPTQQDAPSSVHMYVVTDTDGARVVISGRGSALRTVADSPVVLDIRERLRTLYGDGRALHVEGRPGVELTAVLDLIDINA